MRNIEWCLDFLDELNGESNAVFNQNVYEHLKLARQELGDIEAMNILSEINKMSKQEWIEASERFDKMGVKK